MSKLLIDKMKAVLADNYTLYLKTQNYHWNVSGPNFKNLHDLFMLQYTDLFNANDLIAERILALGSKAPGSFKSFLKLASISEADDGGKTNANQMVKDLIGDQAKIIKTITSALKEAQKVSDEATIGMLVERITLHEKNAWMLKSSL